MDYNASAITDGIFNQMKHFIHLLYKDTKIKFDFSEYLFTMEIFYSIKNNFSPTSSKEELESLYKYTFYKCVKILNALKKNDKISDNLYESYIKLLKEIRMHNFMLLKSSFDKFVNYF